MQLPLNDPWYFPLYECIVFAQVFEEFRAVPDIGEEYRKLVYFEDRCTASRQECHILNL